MDSADELHARLQALAFRRGDAAEANTALCEVRDEYEEAYGRAIPYEILLPAGAPFDRTLLARLWLHLEAKRAAHLPCAELFGAVFRDRTLFFVRGVDLVRELLRAQGLVEADLPAHLDEWREQQARVGAPILALPPPDERGGDPR